MNDWSYEGECGPQTWARKFSKAKGQHQSPINIETNQTLFNPALLERPLKIVYDTNSCSIIKNTGHSFQVDGHTKNHTSVSGGPVNLINENHEYNFLQFHMHWGDDLEKGSEHLLDGQPYAAELHFVNWNYYHYENPKTASESNKNDGLLVLAVFVKIGKHNAEFDKLANCMHQIHLKDHSFNVSVNHINIRNLIPHNFSEYWTYPGSLTTPPCNECVQWIVFKNPIEISKRQLEKCHDLYSVSKEKLCNEKTTIKYNDRPVCQLGDRIVHRSFK